jgi:hypothetical protein
VFDTNFFILNVDFVRFRIRKINLFTSNEYFNRNYKKFPLGKPLDLKRWEVNLFESFLRATLGQNNIPDTVKRLYGGSNFLYNYYDDQ